MAIASSKTQPVARDRDLTGRVALVTGGTRGIGAAICHALAADGAVVAAGYSSNQARADELRHAVEADGGTLSLHQGNIGDAEDCERVVKDVINQHGRLDILVNNAGITVDKMVMKMSAADWDKVLAVDLSGAFYMSKPAIEAALSLRLAGTLEKGIGVTVNCIAAGLTETDMVATIPPFLFAELVERIPMHRPGHPEEIARVVCFLAQDASGYITGQIWDVDGGMNM